MKNFDDINLFNMIVFRNLYIILKMIDLYMFCIGIVLVMIIWCIGIYIFVVLFGVGKVFMFVDFECIVYGKEGILWYS